MADMIVGISQKVLNNYIAENPLNKEFQPSALFNYLIVIS